MSHRPAGLLEHCLLLWYTRWTPSTQQTAGQQQHQPRPAEYAAGSGPAVINSSRDCVRQSAIPGHRQKALPAAPRTTMADASTGTATTGLPADWPAGKGAGCSFSRHDAAVAGLWHSHSMHPCAHATHATHACMQCSLAYTARWTPCIYSLIRQQHALRCLLSCTLLAAP